MIRLMRSRYQVEQRLFEAIEEGNLPEVLSVLNEGTSANAKNRDGQSALLHATRKRHLPMMDALLARGADANAMDNWGFTPLYLVVSNCVGEEQAKAIRVLVAYGADINQRAGIFGRSAL